MLLQRARATNTSEFRMHHLSWADWPEPSPIPEKMRICNLFAAIILLFAIIPAIAAEPVSLSGIYPHLAMFNNEGECGTGAVVPWADRLWVVTYAPHAPSG